MNLDRTFKRWNLYFYRTYRIYLIKFKMKLKARILIGCGLVFLMFASFKVLDPEHRSSESDMSALEQQFWADLNLEYTAKLKNKSVAELVVANKPMFVESRLRQFTNTTQDLSELIHPAYKETIFSLDRPDHNSSRERIVEWLLQQYNVDWGLPLSDSPWKIAAGWVNEQQITPDYAPELGAILHQMATRKIAVADVGYKGSQLKLQLTLEGSQKVAFKPMWYARDFIITGTPYSGKDRHNGEIASFHINRVFGFNRSPLVVGRKVNLETEIIPVATAELLKTFYLNEKNVCFYGKCLYCKDESTGVCGQGTMLEGVLALWLPPTFHLSKAVKHPWARTYRHNKKATWEVYPEHYCDSVKDTEYYRSHPRLVMDFIDASISDYIVGNADRHHYETFRDYNKSMMVMLDNGKSFGNPTWDVQSILAPLKQCCQIRKSTWERLLLLQRGILSQVLKEILRKDPIHPVLDSSHHIAMDRRLEHVVHEVESCIEMHGVNNVVIKDKNS